MLWQKSWLDTRWRFLVPLFVVMVNIWGLVMAYTGVANVLPTVHADAVGSGSFGRLVQEAILAERTYPGFIWYQWFQQNLLNMATLFAVLLGSGNLLSGPSGGTTFTLSLPASRGRWLAVRAILGGGELLAIVAVPSLAISILSPLVGQHYAVSSALVHTLCAFVVAGMFFCLAFFFSTMFADTWRPLLFAIGIAIVAGVVESELGVYGAFRVMSGAEYFWTGHVPWIGLTMCAAISAALLYAAAVSVARKDF